MILRDFIEFVQEKLLDIVLWIKYRTTNRYHVVELGLEPGYYEADDRMLHAVFSIINDFVEIEKANMQRIYEKDSSSKNFFTVNKRSRELGLKYLDWEISLPREDLFDNKGNIESFSHSSQAESAEKIKEIYLWWNDVRPLRKSPMELSGMSDWYDEKIKQGKDLLSNLVPCSFDSDGNPTIYEFKCALTEEEKEQEKVLFKLYQQIEEEQHEEDKKMLIKAIELRRNLWT